MHLWLNSRKDCINHNETAVCVQISCQWSHFIFNTEIFDIIESGYHQLSDVECSHLRSIFLFEHSVFSDSGF